MKTSIVMTSFNYEKFIAQAIQSVINQTVSDWELIIVDDGSRDNSLNIIKEFCEKDARIKLFAHENNANKGLVDSVNLGLEKAQNSLIAFLESDDFWAENYLEEKYKFLSVHPEVVLLYNDIECFGNKERIKRINPYLEKLQNLWKDKETQDLFNAFGTENVVPTFSCVMCKKDLLLSCDKNPPCKPVFDYWLWWQMAEKGEFGFINKKLTCWQLHDESYLTQAGSSAVYLKTRYSFINKIKKLFKKQPKLCLKYKFEQNIILAVIIYGIIYIKRKLPKSIKRLFMAR